MNGLLVNGVQGDVQAWVIAKGQTLDQDPEESQGDCDSICRSCSVGCNLGPCWYLRAMPSLGPCQFKWLNNCHLGPWDHLDQRYCWGSCLCQWLYSNQALTDVHGPNYNFTLETKEPFALSCPSQQTIFHNTIFLVCPIELRTASLCLLVGFLTPSFRKGAKTKMLVLSTIPG